MLAVLERFYEKPKPLVLDFKSSLLEDLWLYLALRQTKELPKTKLNIVDLGAASGNNLEFLSSNYTYKIYIASFNELITENDGSLVGQVGEKLFSHGSTFFEKNTQIDLILIWDLFNYVSSKQANAWFEYLTNFCHDKTIVHAMWSTQDRIPNYPGQFKILTSNRLQCQYAPGERSSQHFNTTQLGKIMPGFVVRRSFQFQNGMQECLFKFKGNE